MVKYNTSDLKKINYNSDYDFDLLGKQFLDSILKSMEYLAKIKFIIFEISYLTKYQSIIPINLCELKWVILMISGINIYFRIIK